MIARSLVLAGTILLAGIPARKAHADTPSALARCRASDLSVEMFVQSAGGPVTGSVYFSNVGTSACILRGTARIRVLGSDDRELPVRLVYSLDFLTGNNPGLVQLSPGDDRSASISIRWSNWCGPTTGPIKFSVILPGKEGHLIAEPASGDRVDVPSCDEQGRPSTLIVGPFQFVHF